VQTFGAIHINRKAIKTSVEPGTALFIRHLLDLRQHARSARGLNFATLWAHSRPESGNETEGPFGHCKALGFKEVRYD
jgi:hypothetical protein